MTVLQKRPTHSGVVAHGAALEPPRTLEPDGRNSYAANAQWNAWVARQASTFLRGKAFTATPRRVCLGQVGAGAHSALVTRATM